MPPARLPDIGKSSD